MDEDTFSTVALALVSTVATIPGTQLLGVHTAQRGDVVTLEARAFQLDLDGLGEHYLALAIEEVAVIAMKHPVEQFRTDLAAWALVTNGTVYCADRWGNVWGLSPEESASPTNPVLLSLRHLMVATAA